MVLSMIISLLGKNYVLEIMDKLKIINLTFVSSTSVSGIVSRREKKANWKKRLEMMVKS